MSQHQEPTSRTLDILSALIAFPTVSRDSNLGLIEWVRDSLRRQGIGARLSYDATGAKAVDRERIRTAAKEKGAAADRCTANESELGLVNGYSSYGLRHRRGLRFNLGRRAPRYHDE